MGEVATIKRWEEMIAGLGILLNPRPLSAAKHKHPGLEGDVDIEGRQLILRVLLPPAFPLILPQILLEYRHDLPCLPHVSPDGQVCYQESEGILLNRHDPQGIIEWALRKAIEVLRKGIAKENQTDFVDEFEAYWQYLGGRNVYNFLDLPGESGEAILFHHTSKKNRYLASSQAAFLSFFGETSLWPKTTLQTVSFFVLPKGTLLVPPRLGERFWSASELRKAVRPALDLLSPRQRRTLIDRRKAKSGVVILVLPRLIAGFALFGVEYQSKDGTHPLAEKDNNTQLKPLMVTHAEKSYLVPRGGGINDLSAKKVLLIGCGSVGGHIAHELVRAGILTLSLVDPDRFSLENTFRHVLGKSKLGKPKASSTKEELISKYPYLTCFAFDSTVEQAIEHKRITLHDFDLLLVAIGNPTVELWLNERMHFVEGHSPVVYTWLEPLGIGGHALVAMPAQEGCFECLYATGEDEHYLANRASFAAPGQRFSTSLSGCNTLFTPYGSLDALQTAGLATKVAIRTLIGKETQSALHSWKGESESFLSQSFQLSNRYNLTESQLHDSRHAFARTDCPICGKNRETT